MPVIMVGLVAEGGLRVNQVHISAATAVLAAVVAQAEVTHGRVTAVSAAVVDVVSKAPLVQMPSPAVAVLVAAEVGLLQSTNKARAAPLV